MVSLLPSFNRDRVNKYLTGIIEINKTFFLNLLKRTIISHIGKVENTGKGGDQSKKNELRS